MSDPDFTDGVVGWLYTTHEIVPETAMILAAGIQLGLALAARHPKYAEVAHAALGADYRRRLGDSDAAFQAMAVASGDERTSPESMADELIKACPLPT